MEKLDHHIRKIHDFRDPKMETAFLNYDTSHSQDSWL